MEFFIFEKVQLKGQLFPALHHLAGTVVDERRHPIFGRCKVVKFRAAEGVCFVYAKDSGLTGVPLGWGADT